MLSAVGGNLKRNKIPSIVNGKLLFNKITKIRVQTQIGYFPVSDPKRTFSKFLSQGGLLKNTFLWGPYPLFQFFLSGIAKPRAKAPRPLRRTELPAFLESPLPRYCQADFLQMVLSLSICPSKGKRGKHLQDVVEYKPSKTDRYINKAFCSQ